MHIANRILYIRDVTNPEKDATQPIPANLGTIPLIEPALPLCIFCPSVSSNINIGIPTIKSTKRYVIRKVSPPCLLVKYGNFHTLPSPMAHPTVDTTKVALFLHLGLSV